MYIHYVLTFSLSTTVHVHGEHIICNTEYSENICQALSAASLSTIKIDPSYDYIIIPY